MTKSSNKKVDASRDSARDRILVVAGQIFAKKGFRATTIREICDRANVNVASINYYFGDKQHLYQQTVVLAREMRVQQVPYPKWESSTPSEEKLRDFIGVILERLVTMQTEPWQVRLLMREILQPTDACRHLVKEYFLPFFQTLLHIVDDLVGERLPEHQRNQIGFSIIGQCLFYRFSAEVAVMMIGEGEYTEHFDRETLKSHITQFSLGAIDRIQQKIGADAVKLETASDSVK